MHPTVFVLLVYAVLVMLSVLVLHRVRPRWTRGRLITVCALSVPAAIVITSVIALIVLAVGVPRTAAADVDGTYHAMGAYFFFVVVFATVTALIGAIAAWLVTRTIRTQPVA